MQIALQVPRAREHGGALVPRHSGATATGLNGESTGDPARISAGRTRYQIHTHGKYIHLFVQTPPLPRRRRVHRRVDVAVRRVVLHVQNIIHTVRDHPASGGETDNKRTKKGPGHFPLQNRQNDNRYRLALVLRRSLRHSVAH